jgi:hypothetical protein
MKYFHLPLIALVLLLAACGPVATATPTPESPTAVPTLASTATPQDQEITLTYGENAQVELVTPAGRTIYIDISNTSLLNKKQPTADDILLTTHTHPDHYLKAFVDAFPGQQLFISTGKIELPDVTIVGIASAHMNTDEIKAEGATNYIYIIETGGLRIVHFGDIGQDALTDDQLTAIGSVDLAITQLANSFSLMDETNLKGFKLIEQYQPRLVLTTHSNRATIEIASKRWPGYFSTDRTIKLSAKNIPTETSFIALGTLAPSYGTIYKLKEWGK